jgi:phosphoribosyl-AMP cyclohydrolase
VTGTTAAAIDGLRFNDQGLVPAIVQEARSGAVLMLAWMDAEALRRTVSTGQATYWSRSRGEYWVKGETSGNGQRVREVRADCDGDTVLLIVEQTGPACHTGAATCFDAAVLATLPDRGPATPAEAG